MRLDIISIQLKAALQETGCPICYLRADAERRYITSMLHEGVNDWDARKHILASLGYCPKHTWQTGLLEVQIYGSPLGNSIIYAQLVGVARQRCAGYYQRLVAARRSGWRRWLSRLWPRLVRIPLPTELSPEAGCRVCQTGIDSERRHTEWLLHHLSDPADPFQEWYSASDGLCLPHLRQALAAANESTQVAAEYLMTALAYKLETLEHDLLEYGRKSAWEYRFEERALGETNAWLRAIQFFGGSRPATFPDGHEPSGCRPASGLR